MNISKRKIGVNIETLIIIMIAGCIIFINTFTIKKLNELENTGRSAIFIKDDLQMIENESVAEEIKDYIPETYKMIELYDENLDLLFQVQFTDPKEGFMTKSDIAQYANLTKIIKENEEGQTAIDIAGKEQDLYFKWLTNTRDEKRLLIIYSSINKVKGLWLFSLACYFTLILVFILLIRLHCKSYHDKINQYKYFTNTLRNQLKD